jgi:hypothetical protein
MHQQAVCLAGWLSVLCTVVTYHAVLCRAVPCCAAEGVRSVRFPPFLPALPSISEVGGVTEGVIMIPNGSTQNGAIKSWVQTCPKHAQIDLHKAEPLCVDWFGDNFRVQTCPKQESKWHTLIYITSSKFMHKRMNLKCCKTICVKSIDFTHMRIAFKLQTTTCTKSSVCLYTPMNLKCCNTICVTCISFTHMKIALSCYTTICTTSIHVYVNGNEP